MGLGIAAAAPAPCVAGRGHATELAEKATVEGAGSMWSTKSAPARPASSSGWWSPISLFGSILLVVQSIDCLLLRMERVRPQSELRRPHFLQRPRPRWRSKEEGGAGHGGARCDLQGSCRLHAGAGAMARQAAPRSLHQISRFDSWSRLRPTPVATSAARELATGSLSGCPRPPPHAPAARERQLKCS
ncbi:unnamed protein product [Urochloa humidicola]